PLRARRENKEGLLEPFVPFETFGDPKNLNCDRDSQGSVWFADVAVSVVRPRNLEHLEEGLLPQKWMGTKIFPIKHWGGCDIDFEWQVPQVEYWLKKHGFSETQTPYDKR
ncbi:MAG TPA: cytidylyltransferase, partial [bacterium]|nr:cytidylyltransferase [bacterium]